MFEVPNVKDGEDELNVGIVSWTSSRHLPACLTRCCLIHCSLEKMSRRVSKILSVECWLSRKNLETHKSPIQRSILYWKVLISSVEVTVRDFKFRYLDNILSRQETKLDVFAIVGSNVGFQRRDKIWY